jgi:alpha-L-rhamnosidase
MLRRTLLVLAALAAVVPFVPRAQQPHSGPLETGFLNPPPEARLRCYWWWLNGNTNEAAITRDLEQMRAKGYGGALLVDANGSEQQRNRMVPAGPTFGSARWRELYRHALKEAARLGLEISLNVESGWNLGGPDVKPEQGAKLLTYSRVTVQGPGEIRRALPQPPAAIGFYRDIAVLAYPLRHGEALPRRPIRQLALKTASQEFGMSAPNTLPLLEDLAAEPGEQDAQVGEVLDLSAKMTPEGAFAWQAPAGAWEILRVGYMASGAKVSTSSGAWQGLAIDYLDRAEFEHYWHENIEPLLADAKPYLGKTLRYLVTDSWELGGVNWTPKFREEFRARRGYDPVPYLPVVSGRILESRDTSNRFLNDLRRTVADLVIDGHYRPFAEFAARYGLGIHPESGGPHGAPLDALETLGVSAFPQMEFWARAPTHRVRDEERFFVKQGSSAAHTYGKTLVAAEGMTSIGPQWEESIWQNLKPTFDQAACEGLNRLVWHTFTSSPKEAGLPGQEYFAGTHLNPNVTWWNKAGPFLTYINRSQFLLQQGVPVSDVLIYYGDNIPNFVQYKGADPAKVLPGYDYDAIDEYALTHRTSVKDGRVVLPEGTSYQVLVLPDRPSISLAALRAVQKLVAGGAPVLGPRPERTTGIGDDNALRSIANEIWSKVHTNQTARALLLARGVLPDFEGPADTDYVHRRAGETEIYFVRNGKPEALDAQFTLRVKGKAPELWHPDSGLIEDAPAYEFTADGRTRLPLALEPNGSVFVVFRRAGTGRKATAPAVAAAPPKPVNGPWTVRFTPGWGAPAQATFDKLLSWSEHPDPGIRYYSGTARYATRIDLPAGREWTLDLGDVREIAEVWLNGKPLGILWKKPFTVELASGARAGPNELEIEVVNLWPNRLIGDQQLPPEKRLTNTNITKFTANSPLMPSGLLGPVVLR